VPSGIVFVSPFKDPPKRTQSPRQRFKGTRCPHEPQSLEQNVLQKGLERKTKAFPRQKVPHVPSPPPKTKKEKESKGQKAQDKGSKGRGAPMNPKVSNKTSSKPPSSKGLQRGKQNKSNRELNNSTVEVPFFPFVVYKAPKRKKKLVRIEEGERGDPNPFPPPNHQKGKGNPRQRKREKPPRQCPTFLLFPSGNRARKTGQSPPLLPPQSEPQRTPH